MTDENLPKQDLLLKILNMTTSDNDGQALVAIRKANALLASAGWTWEKLLAGKIRVVEDPFKNLRNPRHEHTFQRDVSVPERPTPPPPPPKPKQQSTASWKVQNPSAAPRTGTQRFPYSSQTNQYPNSCYCCGVQVDVQKGFIMKPSDHNSRAKSKWEVICSQCNIDRPPIQATKAPRAFAAQHASINPSLGNL